MITLLLYLVLTAGGAIAIGVYVLRALRLERTFGACGAAAVLALCMQAAFAAIVGAVNLRLAGLVLCAAQVAAIGALIIDGSVMRAWRGRRKAAAPRPAFIAQASMLVTALVLASALVSAMAPITAWDAGVAHAAVAARYAAANAIGFVPGNNYCGYPQLMQTLYALALAFRVPGFDAPRVDGFADTERLAAATSWIFAVLACVAAYSAGERLGGRTCGAIAAANLAAAPVFADQAAAPSIDLAFASAVLAAIYLLFAWRENGRWGHLALGAALAGSSCGIRHTGHLVIALLAVGVLVSARDRRTARTVSFLGIAAVFAAPWLWRSWRIVGNPVYPFFASRLASTNLPDVDVAAIGTHSSLQGTDVLRLVTFPWSLTMDPAHYGGWSVSPGVAWLVLGVIGTVVGGRRALAIGGFSGAGLAAIFFFQRFARYALPFAAPMMIVAALPYEKLPKLRGPIVAALIVSFVVGLVPAMAHAAVRLPVLAGLESREEFLARRVERYAAMDWFAENTDADATVLSFDPRGYYFRRHAYTNFEAFKHVANSSIGAQRDWLAENGIDYVFYPDKYVKESPAFRETGVAAMIDGWRADTAHFVSVKVFDLPNPRDGGTERVEVYAFRP